MIQGTVKVQVLEVIVREMKRGIKMNDGKLERVKEKEKEKMRQTERQVDRDRDRGKEREREREREREKMHKRGKSND